MIDILPDQYKTYLYKQCSDREKYFIIRLQTDRIFLFGQVTFYDLVQLSLCLLMRGEMSLKDRTKTAYQITEKAVTVDLEERDKIESVLYVMADKFLEPAEMDELMEVIRMTRLGQKLVNKGREEEKLEIANNLIGTLDEQTIAEKTKLPLKTVLELKEKR